MFRISDVMANSVLQSYRVECNHGSKYFTDYDKAFAYYEYLQAQKFDAEMWMILLYYDGSGELVKGIQKLVIAESDEGIADFT